MQQLSLYPAKEPLIVAYGLGVDSTAVLVELYNKNIRPDAILFADTGDEKKETYNYLPVIQQWLQKVDFPQVQVVRYVVSNFKNWPPYYTLGQNCLTNGTLPSLAFGFKSCSLKWKVTPQNKWTDAWTPARECWAAGQQVRKIIGYDNDPKDKKRYAVAKDVEDPKYSYWYPLIEWGMGRNDCKEIIRSAGLAVPPKSACVFCPSTTTDELKEHNKEYLRFIVIMEARAKPRLTDIEGLWRKGVKGTRNGKPKPGTMTEFIINEGLLPLSEVQGLQELAPSELIQTQEMFANGLEIPDWHDFLEKFTAEDALHEGCRSCSIM